MKVYTLIALVLTSAYACHTEKGKDQSKDALVLTDTITIDSKSPILNKIIVQKVEEQEYQQEFRTTGTVQPIDGKMAEIATPFAGRISKINAHLGQKVRAGSTICELSSADYFDATKSYFQALSQKNQIEKQYKRQQDLLRHGVGSQKDLELIQSEYESTKSLLDQESARMKLFHADLEKLNVGQALRITSPIDGEIVKFHAVLGQYLKEDAEPIAIVANLSKIWVIAKVKERYVGTIQQNDKAVVYSEAGPNEKLWGKIIHIGELIDPESRCIEVIIACDNPSRKLKPGMFTRVDFLSRPKKGIVILAEAVLQSENQSYVLIKVGQNKYLKRMVNVESLKDERVRIIDGLGVGETIVVSGGIYIEEE